MIALTALLIIAVWVVLCAFLARRAPGWLRLRPIGPLRTFGLFALLLVAPFIDHFVGMWQFDSRCKELAVWVSPDALKVKRAGGTNHPSRELAGIWISVRSYRLTYEDIDTGKTFYSYESLVTNGGRIAQIGLLGQAFSCEPRNIYETNKTLNLDQLLKEGKKS